MYSCCWDPWQLFSVALEKTGLAEAVHKSLLEWPAQLARP